MSDRTGKPRRYQFSLRTLLVAVAVAAGAAFGYVKCIEPYRLQREAMATITTLGGSFKTEEATGWVRWLDRNAQDVVVVDLADCDKPDEYLPHLARLPKLRTVVVGGHSVGDKQLAALGRTRSLRGLVLDSTKATDEGLERLKEALPELVVYASERRACAELEKLGAGLARAREGFVESRHGRLVTNPPTWLRDDADAKYFRDPLGYVDLMNLPVTDADLKWLGNLLDVKMLELGTTSITGECFRDAPALSSLDYLSVQCTRINDDAVVHIARYTNLTSLDLSQTDLSDEAMVHVVACDKLEKLYLWGTRITDVGMKHIPKLSHLQELITPSAIGDEGLAAVAKLPMLEELFLFGLNVTDEGLAPLRRIKSLRRLCCDEMKITDRGLPHLMVARELLT